MSVMGNCDSPLILIVEDDKHLSTINRRALESEGYAVVSAHTLAEVREMLSPREGANARLDPDVILLDVKLPDGSGVDLCREIREMTAAHIIFLTSVTEASGELEGLRAGGNDYLRKPYGIDLLRERVRNALARERKPPQHIKRGPLTLDTIARRAHIDGEDAQLQQIEFSLLLYLILNEGQTVGAEQLYEKVWGQPMAGNKSALQKAVSRVRKSIEPAGYTVSALYGKGYVFEQV